MNARYIFIKPPSMDILQHRLEGRNTETAESIQTRLSQAERELAFADTKGAFDKVLVNDDLENAYQELEAYLLALCSH